MQVNCAKCSRPIGVSDVVESSSGRLSHVDCNRPHTLTAEERALLFLYCSNHPVAQCSTCGINFQLMELGADALGGRTNLCSQCRRDLTDSVRGHVYHCVQLGPEISAKVQQVRDAAQRLIKQSQQLCDDADVLIREAEANLVEAQKALRALMARRATS